MFSSYLTESLIADMNLSSIVPQTGGTLAIGRLGF
jgi:hypothetical protein